MKKRRLFVMLSVVLCVLLLGLLSSCDTIRQWSGNHNSFDKKQIRENRKALREQMEDDELWGGDVEYNPWEENDEYDRDRW